jgi:hypothetical protein
VDCEDQSKRENLLKFQLTLVQPSRPVNTFDRCLKGDHAGASVATSSFAPHMLKFEPCQLYVVRELIDQQRIGDTSNPVNL